MGYGPSVTWIEPQKEHLHTTVEGSKTSPHPVAPGKEEHAIKGHAKGKQVADHLNVS